MKFFQVFLLILSVGMVSCNSHEGNETSVVRRFLCDKDTTFVAQVGEYLQFLKVDYCVDTLGRPYQVDNLILQLGKDVDPDSIKAWKGRFNPDRVKTCLCDESLQNWIWDESIEINIEEKTSQVSEAAKREGGNAMYNYIVHIPNRGQNLIVDISKDEFSRIITDSIGQLIAILDTGIDPALSEMGTVKLNSVDAHCSEVASYGWNFVGNNAIISDDNGHGTAVAGIIAETLASVPEEQTCNARFLILKTLDANGVGGLFDAICAIRYAVGAGADVINMSWGYYGLDLDLVREAIERKRENTIVVTSMGNEGIKTDVEWMSHWHYPSHYARSIIGVYEVAGDRRQSIWQAGGITPNKALWEDSNFSESELFSAPAFRIPVWQPTGVTGQLSSRTAEGTSYSAAFTTALIVIDQCCFSSEGLTALASPSAMQTRSVSHRGFAFLLRPALLGNQPCN